MLFFSNYAHTFFFYSNDIERRAREKKRRNHIIYSCETQSLLFILHFTSRDKHDINSCFNQRKTQTSLMINKDYLSINSNQIQWDTRDVKSKTPPLFFHFFRQLIQSHWRESSANENNRERERERKTFRRWHYTLI